MLFRKRDGYFSEVERSILDQWKTLPHSQLPQRMNNRNCFKPAIYYESPVISRFVKKSVFSIFRAFYQAFLRKKTLKPNTLYGLITPIMGSDISQLSSWMPVDTLSNYAVASMARTIIRVNEKNLVPSRASFALIALSTFNVLSKLCGLHSIRSPTNNKANTSPIETKCNRLLITE